MQPLTPHDPDLRPTYNPSYPPYPQPYQQQWGPYRQAANGWPRPDIVRRRAAPRPFRPVELVAAVAIAAVVDLGTWHDGVGAGGFGLALVFALLPVAMLASAPSRRVTPRLAVLGALTLLVALRCVYEPTVGTCLSGIALVGAIAIALRRKELSVPDVFLSALAGVGALPSRISAFARGAMKVVRRTKMGRVSVLPIAIPALLVLVFLGVFALANPVVASGVSLVSKAIARVISFPSIDRIALFVSALGLATALVRPGLWFSKGAEQAALVGEPTKASLQIARNALAGLNVLFLGFLALDAKFLMSGSAPAGMTTQAYAHQGAFWLTVALLMLTALIGVFFRGALAHDAHAKIARTLAYVWMGQGLFLAVGTYRRLAIHIAHSGLSDLRIVGILGTTLVVSGVVLVLLKLQRQKTFTWLVRRQLDAFALTAMVYFVTPTHAISASVNVDRVTHGEYRPLVHSFAQSHHAESAATLLPLLHHSDPRVQEGIGALLTEERETLRAEVKAQDSWRGRDLASVRALAVLEAHNAEIDSALGTASPDDARRVLLEIARVANEDRSFEDILAIPAARREDPRPNGNHDIY